MEKDEKWQKVTEEEFCNFAKRFPLLKGDTFRFGDPPVFTLNDFSDGKIWPESIIAKVILNTSMEGHPAYDGEQDEYYIRSDYVNLIT